MKNEDRVVEFAGKKEMSLLCSWLFEIVTDIPIAAQKFRGPINCHGSGGSRSCFEEKKNLEEAFTRCPLREDPSRGWISLTYSAKKPRKKPYAHAYRYICSLINASKKRRSLYLSLYLSLSLSLSLSKPREHASRRCLRGSTIMVDRPLPLRL